MYYYRSVLPDYLLTIYSVTHSFIIIDVSIDQSIDLSIDQSIDRAMGDFHELKLSHDGPKTWFPILSNNISTTTTTTINSVNTTINNTSNSNVNNNSSLYTQGMVVTDNNIQYPHYNPYQNYHQSSTSLSSSSSPSTIIQLSMQQPSLLPPPLPRLSPSSVSSTPLQAEIYPYHPSHQHDHQQQQHQEQEHDESNSDEDMMLMMMMDEDHDVIGTIISITFIHIITIIQYHY